LIQVDLDAFQSPSGSRILAYLDFLATPGQDSAIVPMRASNLLATQKGGIVITNGTSYHGRLIIVGEQPLLVMNRTPEPILTLYGKPGTPYVIEHSTNLSEELAWSTFTQVNMSGRHAQFAVPSTSLAEAFYRAYEPIESAPSMQVYEQNAAELTLRVFGHPGSMYEVRTATSLAPNQSWMPFMVISLTNVWHEITWKKEGEPARYFQTIEH